MKKILILPVLGVILVGTLAFAEKKPDPDPDPIHLYTTAKYVNCEDCDYNAVNNLIGLANLDLWPRMPEPSAPGGFARMPCGGDPVCEEPLLAPRVKCSLEVTDCNFGKPGEAYQDPKVLKTYFLECRGDIACSFEHKNPRACCVVTGQIKGKVQDPNKPCA